MDMIKGNMDIDKVQNTLKDGIPDVGSLASDAAGAAGSFMMGSFLPIIDKLVGIFHMILPLILLAGLGYFGWKAAANFWQESKANEWMLVIRNGELIKSGIGLACWVMPGDQTIKFPSLINKLTFSA
jgi:hypothetical protein